MSTYTHEPGLGKGPAYSISGRQDTIKESAVPGPGAYTPELPTKNSGVHMSGRYASSISSDSPGPGAYPINSLLGPPTAKIFVHFAQI